MGSDWRLAVNIGMFCNKKLEQLVMSDLTLGQRSQGQMYMVSTIEAVHWDIALTYVSNDLDPYLKVTDVNDQNKFQDLFGGTFCGYI